VHTHGGKKPTDKKLFSWAKQGQEIGAGEILFTSMDHDGTKAGFAIDPLGKLNELLSIPIIASGGAGTKEHFSEVFTLTGVDAALAASIFHFGEIPIPELKNYLNKIEIPIRL
jgi:cyclase